MSTYSNQFLPDYINILLQASSPSVNESNHNSTLDHETGGHEFSSTTIFGSLNELDILQASVSIILVITAVVALNFIIHVLYKITYETPFEPLLVALEHELMIVGSIAFIFKIVLSLTYIPHGWHLALEYADILIPVVAFVFCFQGFLLILMTIVQTNIWNRGYNILLEELLDKFYVVMNDNHTNTIITSIFNFQIWIDRIIIKEKMKFRIYRLIFCDQYRITRNSLAFDSYVLGVYEKYLLEVIEIRAFDWLFVTAVILLNWFRNSIIHVTFVQSCHDEDKECINLDAIQSFTCIGFLILMGIMMIAYISYHYEKRILTSKSVNRVSDYPIFLKGGEQASNAGKGKHRLRCGSVIHAKVKKEAEEKEKRHKNVNNYLNWMMAITRVRLDAIRAQKVADSKILNNPKTSSSSCSSSKKDDVIMIGSMDIHGNITMNNNTTTTSTTNHNHNGVTTFASNHTPEVSISTGRNTARNNGVASGRESSTHKNNHHISSSSSSSPRRHSISSSSSSPRRHSISFQNPFGSSSLTTHHDSSGSSSSSSATHPRRNSSNSINSSNSSTIKPREFGLMSAVGRNPVAATTATAASSSSISMVKSKSTNNTAIENDDDNEEDQEELVAKKDNNDNSHNNNDNDDDDNDLEMGIKTKKDHNVQNGTSKSGFLFWRRSSIDLGNINNNSSNDDVKENGNFNDDDDDDDINTKKTIQKPSSTFHLFGYSSNRIHATTATTADNHHHHHHRIYSSRVDKTNDNNNNDVISIYSHNNKSESDDGDVILYDRGIHRFRRIAIQVLLSLQKQAISVGSSKSNKSSNISSNDKEKRAYLLSSQRSDEDENDNDDVDDDSNSNINGSDMSYKSPYENKSGSSNDIIKTTTQANIEKNPLGITLADKKKMKTFAHRMNVDIKTIFFRNRGIDYFRVVKLSMMVLSLYFGLWLTNYCSLAFSLEHHNIEWMILSLTPSILGMILYVYIIKCAALLKAMTFCDTDVISGVLEETEASELLAVNMREKILIRLNASGQDPTVELQNLFQELDTSGDNRIERVEFERLLIDMGIQFSRKNWEQMFRRIDRDMDQNVTLDDLFIFVFPQHNVAQIEENLRIKTLQGRIRKYSHMYQLNISQKKYSHKKRLSQLLVKGVLSRKSLTHDEKGGSGRDRRRSSASVSYSGFFTNNSSGRRHSATVANTNNNNNSSNNTNNNNNISAKRSSKSHANRRISIFNDVLHDSSEKSLVSEETAEFALGKYDSDDKRLIDDRLSALVSAKTRLELINSIKNNSISTSTAGTTTSISNSNSQRSFGITANDLSAMISNKLSYRSNNNNSNNNNNSSNNNSNKINSSKKNVTMAIAMPLVGFSSRKVHGNHSNE